jgi:hypothetical protein
MFLSLGLKRGSGRVSGTHGDDVLVACCGRLVAVLDAVDELCRTAARNAFAAVAGEGLVPAPVVYVAELRAAIEKGVK